MMLLGEDGRVYGTLNSSLWLLRTSFADALEGFVTGRRAIMLGDMEE
jgi:hypothetical protein